MRTLGIVAVVLGLSTLLVAPSGAGAAYTSCTYDAGTKTVTATLSGGVLGQLAVSTGKIAADGTQCGAATTTNTDTVVLSSVTPSGCHALDLSGGAFAPGATDEVGASDEIEIQAAGVGCLTIRGSSGPDHLTAGLGGGSPGNVQVNLNAAEADGVDADLVADGSTILIVEGAGGNDTLSGGGGAGTGDPDTSALLLRGDSGNDGLTGPAISARGGPDNDSFTIPAAGGMLIDYSVAGEAVTASLPAGTATGKDGSGGTDTYSAPGSIEFLGSSFDDTIAAVSGGDTIDAGAGDDTVTSDNGVADIVICGLGTDSASGDALDDLDPDCETRSPGPTTPTPPAPTPPSSGGGTQPVPYTQPATTTVRPVRFKQVVTLPPTSAEKTCAGRGRLTIRFDPPADDPIAKATVKLDGRVAKRLGGKKKVPSAVSLEDLPEGRFTIKAELTLRSGAALKGSRAYPACTRKT